MRANEPDCRLYLYRIYPTFFFGKARNIVPKSKHRHSRGSKSISRPGRNSPANSPQSAYQKTLKILEKNLGDPVFEKLLGHNDPHSVLLMLGLCCKNCISQDGSMISGSLGIILAEFCGDELSLDVAANASAFLLDHNFIEMDDNEDIVSIPRRFWPTQKISDGTEPRLS